MMMHFEWVSGEKGCEYFGRKEQTVMLLNNTNAHVATYGFDSIRNHTLNTHQIAHDGGCFHTFTYLNLEHLVWSNALPLGENPMSANVGHSFESSWQLIS